MKRTWIVAMSLVVLWIATVQAQDTPNLDPARIGVGAIGNGGEVGSLVWLKPGKFTSIGVDGRWYDSLKDENEALSLSLFVSWNAIPEVNVPLGGLFPQLGLPLPESVRALLNLGGSIGALWEQVNGEYEFNNRDALVKLFAEAQFPIVEQAALAIRYEYAFDGDGDLLNWVASTSVVPQHQAFLVLKYEF